MSAVALSPRPAVQEEVLHARHLLLSRHCTGIEMTAAGRGSTWIWGHGHSAAHGEPTQCLALSMANTVHMTAMAVSTAGYLQCPRLPAFTGTASHEHRPK